MNKGTKARTILRIIFSIYTGFCMWEVSIKELGDKLDAPWLAVICSVVIVAAGLLVDILTTYFNNDYTEAGAIGTEMTRNMKKLEKEFIFEDQDTEVNPDE